MPTPNRRPILLGDIHAQVIRFHKYLQQIQYLPSQPQLQFVYTHEITKRFTPDLLVDFFVYLLQMYSSSLALYFLSHTKTPIPPTPILPTNFSNFFLTVFPIFNAALNYHPVLSVAHCLTDGFIERKLIMCNELVELILEKENELRIEQSKKSKGKWTGRLVENSPKSNQNKQHHSTSSKSPFKSTKHKKIAAKSSLLHSPAKSSFSAKSQKLRQRIRPIQTQHAQADAGTKHSYMHHANPRYDDVPDVASSPTGSQPVNHSSNTNYQLRRPYAESVASFTNSHFDTESKANANYPQSSTLNISFPQNQFTNVQSESKDMWWASPLIGNLQNKLNSITARTQSLQQSMSVSRSASPATQTIPTSSTTQPRPSSPPKSPPLSETHPSIRRLSHQMHSLSERVQAVEHRLRYLEGNERPSTRYSIDHEHHSNIDDSRSPSPRHSPTRFHDHSPLRYNSHRPEIASPAPSIRLTSRTPDPTSYTQRHQQDTKKLMESLNKRLADTARMIEEAKLSANRAQG